MFKIITIRSDNNKILKDINYLMSQISLSTKKNNFLNSKKFKELIKQKNVFLLGVVGNGKIVGTLTVYFVRIPSGLIAIAEDLIVDEPYRKWGVGRVLMERGIKLAREKKVRHISLRTNPNRIEANKLYQALGFEKMETNFYRINLFK